MSRPKYRAYKPVAMSDGILTWTQNNFDNTVEWTPDDIEMFVSFSMKLAPNARITAMQARLDSLQNVTPEIKMYADAIRAIHAGLDNHHSLKSKAEADALARAEELWQKIIILRDLIPPASRGKQYSNLQKKFREYQQRTDEAKHNQWRKWQADEKVNNAQFAKQSKQEQAKRLKLKHSIPYTPATIAKRLEPLSPSKKK